MQLSADEINSIKKDHAHEMGAPASYWEDKFRLQRLNIELLRKHLPLCGSISPSSSVHSPCSEVCWPLGLENYRESSQVFQTRTAIPSKQDLPRKRAAQKPTRQP